LPIAQLRDVYSIGLKTAVKDVPEATGPNVSERLTERLLIGISTDSEDTSLREECLDILADLLRRFGNNMDKFHERIMGTVLDLLAHPKLVVRKRAITCIGQLATVLQDPLLNRLTESLLTWIEAPREGHDVRTLIQTIGTVSRTVGYRLGRHLPVIMPLFLRYLGDPDDEEMQTEEANDLRENILHAFESFVVRCPRETTGHIDAVIESVLSFMVFDPNYDYGEEEDDEEEDEEEDEEGDYDEGEYSDFDDDDTSWKVRRAAVQVLSGLVTARPELLSKVNSLCGETLVDRFKEREENVRLDVLTCYKQLLRQTLMAQQGGVSSQASQPGAGGTGDSGGESKMAAPDAPSLIRVNSSSDFLEQQLPRIIASANKQLSGKSVKTKALIFEMLHQLAGVLRGGMVGLLEAMLPNVIKCLSDKNSNLMLETLSFVRLLLETHEPAAMHPFIEELLPAVLQCATEDWYKIIAEALRVVGVVTSVMRPIDASADMFAASAFDHTPHVTSLYNAVLPRLAATDIDQEIKSCAIAAMGRVLAHLADGLEGDQLDQVLPLFMDRMRNEITRMPTLKALALIARSPLDVDLSSILPAAMETLGSFLRQQLRALKQNTLEALNALVMSYGSQVDASLLGNVLKESAVLVDDSDLQLSHLSLSLCATSLAQNPSCVAIIRTDVLPAALNLASSPLLQGLALRSLLGLLAELVKSNATGLSFDELFGMLMQPVAKGGELPKQAVANLARCAAALCVNTTQDALHATVATLVADASSEDRSDASRQLALICLGEVGKLVDLSAHHRTVHTVVLAAFDVQSEEVKSAAAFALGSMTVGNIAGYLPVLMESLSSEDGAHTYLLLSSLKELISYHCGEGGEDGSFTGHIESIMPILFRHCESEEEGSRNMVAECLGKLALLSPETIVPSLASKCEDRSFLTRWTIVTAVKYITGATTQEPGSPLAEHIDAFLSLLRDDNLAVRRAAILTVNSVAHHQPTLIEHHLQETILPLLYTEMRVNPDLKRIVDLGPFKHKVDDGLPLRKAAFSCMDTLLDTLASRVAVGAFLPLLVESLGDHDDVQMLAHQILSKLCKISPGAISGAADALLVPLDKIFSKFKAKDAQVGTEVERANDVIRSALRGVDAMGLIPDLAATRRYIDFLDAIRKKEHLRGMMDGIRNERGAEFR
jgi:cullin-associated NEDD8-dissociated protein 1